MLCKNHVRNGFENPFFRKKMGLKLMPGMLSTNNPVSKVSGLRPSTFETGLLVLLYNYKVPNMLKVLCVVTTVCFVHVSIELNSQLIQNLQWKCNDLYI